MAWCKRFCSHAFHVDVVGGCSIIDLEFQFGSVWPQEAQIRLRRPVPAVHARHARLEIGGVGRHVAEVQRTTRARCGCQRTVYSSFGQAVQQTFQRWRPVVHLRSHLPLTQHGQCERQ